FSPPCPVHCRLVARDNVATREPLLVLRTSGSAPKFPISMTLLRLRLTTDLQTLGGSGPRATTVYDPQVILSIKDTPLVLKFCRPPLCRNGGPQYHCVLDWPTVVMRPSRDLAEAERLIQTPGRRVRRPHLEVHCPDATAGARLPSGLRFGRTSVRGLRGGRVRNRTAGALPFQEGEEQGRRGGQALERRRSGPDPTGDLVGVAHRPIAHHEAGPHGRIARQLLHGEHRWREQRLHPIGVKHIQRAIDLSAERIEARRHRLGPEL